MKLGLLAASLVLVAGGAVGCGDDSDSGGGDGGGGGGEKATAASKEDFCQAFQDFYDDLTSVTGREDNLGELLKDAVAKIEETGTPEDITDDAKDGLQLVLDQINELPDQATAEDIAKLDTELSEEDQAKSDEFSEYLNETCPDIGGSATDPETESGSGSDSGS